MLASAKRLFGLIDVKEKGDFIIVEGLPADSLSRDIKRIWGTSKVANNLFHRFTNSSIVIYKFYAIELEYILNTILTGSYSSTSRVSAKAVIQKLYENTWLMNTKTYPELTLNEDALKVFKKIPLESQTDFFRAYDEKTQQYVLRGYMLAAPPGSGKTLSGLMLAEQLGSTLTVVVCPKIAIHKPWIETVETEYKKGPRTYWTSTMSRPIDGKDQVVICHYESISRIIEQIKLISRKRVFVILDECHNFNDVKSQRTENFVNLCNNLGDSLIGLVWASGTPLKALGSEMIPFLRTADPYFTPKVETSFKKIFGVSQARAVDVLSHRIGLSSFKVEKKAVVSGEPIETTIKVKFKGMEDYTLEKIRLDMQDYIQERVKYYKEHRKKHEELFNLCLDTFYKTLKKSDEIDDFNRYKKGVKTVGSTMDLKPYSELITWLNKYENKTIVPALPSTLRNQFKDVKSVIKYTHLKIRGEALGRILGKKRTQCNVDIIKHTDLSTIIDASEKKTLIFSSFIEVVKETDKKLKGQGYKPLIVYGETNNELPAMVKRFGEDINANPMIATYQSLSTAVPIIMANSVILLNQPFRAHEREQSISRVYRLGQDSQVRIFNVLLDTGEVPNISTRSLDIMKWSQDQVDMMMGTTSPGISVESMDYISDAIIPWMTNINPQITASNW